MAIKTINPDRKFRFISIGDDAIDLTATVNALPEVVAKFKEWKEESEGKGQVWKELHPRPPEDALELYQKEYSEQAVNKYIKFKMDQAPTWFVCKVLSGVVRSEIRDKLDEIELVDGQYVMKRLNLRLRSIEAIKYGLVEIVNGPELVFAHDAEGRKIVSSETIGKFDPDLIQEVGAAIWKNGAEPTESEKKTSSS